MLARYNSMACTAITIITAASVLSGISGQDAVPQLNGAKFRITTVAEDGFVDISKASDGALSFSGYCIDVLRAIARPDRANFTFDLVTPSGYGSKCSPQLKPANGSATENPFQDNYWSQYKCGESDVTDDEPEYLSDMFLSLYYVTPTRQRVNQFTLPFHPPGTGTLTMFGTATGIHNFSELAAMQEAGKQGPACAGENAAYIDYLKSAFPTMQFKEIPSSVPSFLEALRDGTCDLLVIDYPVATRFVLQRSLAGECNARGKPIGIIGEPLGYGLNQYAIGIRNVIPREVVDAMSYWLNVLMTCSSGDLEGDCPLDTGGNLYDVYNGVGGTGDECGYVLDPQSGLSSGAIAGIVVGSVVGAVLLTAMLFRYRNKKKAEKRAEKMRQLQAEAEAEIAMAEAKKRELENENKCLRRLQWDPSNP